MHRYECSNPGSSPDCYFYNLEVMGIRRGYAGLIEGDFIELNSNSVSDIMQRGGTFLLSARCEES